jgi:tRNA-dihydrouridine synthase B
VTGKLSGSALMRDPRLAAAIMQAVKSAVQVPVTLKMRLGWDDHNLNAAEFGRIAEDAGLSMLAVHGRTRCQMYNGDADWHKIAAVVDAVSIPVIANGDIRCVDTAKQAIAASGAAGVMVGRGAQGRPWVLAQIGDVLAGRQMRATPSIRARHACMRAHLDDMITHYGAAAMRLARKHIAWYAYGLPGAAELRDIANNTTDAATVFAAVDQFFHKLYDQAEAA